MGRTDDDYIVILRMRGEYSSFSFLVRNNNAIEFFLKNR